MDRELNPSNKSQDQELDQELTEESPHHEAGSSLEEWDGSMLGQFARSDITWTRLDNLKLASPLPGITGYLSYDGYLAATLDLLRPDYGLFSSGSYRLEIDGKQCSLINVDYEQIDFRAERKSGRWHAEMKRNIAFYRLFGIDIRPSRLVAMKKVVDTEEYGFITLLDNLKMGNENTPDILKCDWTDYTWDFRRELRNALNIRNEESYLRFYITQLRSIHEICKMVKSIHNFESELILCLSELNL